MTADHLVLIVEDDDDVREAVADALAIAGYQTATADNGKAALELLEQGIRPCLIVLDLMMPVMNGWTFLETIRRDPRFAELPVCVVSAVPEARLPRDTVGTFPKPVNLLTLLGTVEAYC